MDTNNEKSRWHLLQEDQLLRREAGEGWHTAGLNETLLGAIVLREMIMDDIISDDFRAKAEEEQAQDWEEYESQVQKVNEIKEQHGIDQPPPLEIDSLPDKES